VSNELKFYLAGNRPKVNLPEFLDKNTDKNIAKTILPLFPRPTVAV